MRCIAHRAPARVAARTRRAPHAERRATHLRGPNGSNAATPRGAARGVPRTFVSPAKCPSAADTCAATAPPPSARLQHPRERGGAAAAARGGLAPPCRVDGSAGASRPYGAPKRVRWTTAARPARQTRARRLRAPQRRRPRAAAKELL
jgi:hypothetical protein